MTTISALFCITSANGDEGLSAGVRSAADPCRCLFTRGQRGTRQIATLLIITHDDLTSEGHHCDAVLLQRSDFLQNHHQNHCHGEDYHVLREVSIEGFYIITRQFRGNNEGIKQFSTRRRKNFVHTLPLAPIEQSDDEEVLPRVFNAQSGSGLLNASQLIVIGPPWISKSSCYLGYESKASLTVLRPR